MRNNIKKNEIWFYHSIQDALNKLDYIIETSFLNNQPLKTEILLYNINKKLSIIFELMETKESGDCNSKRIIQKRYSEDNLFNLRKQMKKQR